MSDSSKLQKPTVEQQEAINYDGKSLLITAGPGAGKTYVLVKRIKYLLEEKHVDPESILVITFTRKAADQLKEKLSKDKDIGASAVNKMFINTIHSFCIHFLSENGCSDINLLESTSGNECKLMFLRKHKKELGFNREAYMSGRNLHDVINKFDEYMTFGLTKDCREGLIKYIEENRPVSQEYKDLIASCGEGDDFEYPYDEVKERELKASAYNSRYLAIAKAYPKYKELLEQENSFDFNYLQVKVRDIIKNDETIAENSRFKNILIDEYQDIDPIQNDIFNILSKYAESFTVVGDDDQSIYAFRGSVPKYFTDFADDIKVKKNPNESVTPLSTNFRSCPEIVEYNEDLIKGVREIDKTLVPDRKDKGGVYYLINENVNVQAEKIANIILYLHESEKIDRYDDIALLLSSVTYAKGINEILEAFKNKGIPYSLSENDSLMSNPEVKAMIILLWYMKESNDKIIFSEWEKNWLNLSAFSLVQDILELDDKTCQILSDLEEKFQKDVMDTEKEVYKEFTGETSKKRSFKGIFDRDQEIIDVIFKRVERFDLSTKTRKELEEIGITNEHDLTLFENLNNIKQELYDENTKFYERPSVLEVYYDILQYSGILKDRLENPTEENQRILRNLGQITETIANYEEIITKYSMNGLLWYIFSEFDSYSTSTIPTDEIDKVQIMTVHKSKGLEFPVVILGSIIEGKFPKHREEYEEATKDYLNRSATYYTPPEYLEYKKEAFTTEDASLEENILKEENKESKRVFYVGTTRAEDILILSALMDKEGKTPKIMDRIIEDGNYSELTDNYNIIAEKTCESKTFEPERLKLSYTHLSEYDNCSQEYNLRYNYQFMNSKNKALTFGVVAHTILNLIHQKQKAYQKEGKGQITSKEEIKEIIERVKEFNQNLKNNENDEFKEIEEAIYTYWEENKDKYYIIGSEVPFSITYNDFDLEGKIDLIVKDKNTNDITIIDFKTTEEENVEVLKERYQKQLFIYAMALKKIPEYNEEYHIKEAMIYSVKFSKEIPIPISDVDINDITTSINSSVEKILDGDFKPCSDKSKCFNCAYNKSICRR